MTRLNTTYAEDTQITVVFGELDVGANFPMAKKHTRRITNIITGEALVLNNWILVANDFLELATDQLHVKSLLEKGEYEQAVLETLQRWIARNYGGKATFSDCVDKFRARDWHHLADRLLNESDWIQGEGPTPRDSGTSAADPFISFTEDKEKTVRPKANPCLGRVALISGIILFCILATTLIIAVGTATQDTALVCPKIGCGSSGFCAQHGGNRCRCNADRTCGFALEGTCGGGCVFDFQCRDWSGGDDSCRCSSSRTCTRRGN